MFYSHDFEIFEIFLKSHNYYNILYFISVADNLGASV